jgi:L-seryl-tRNA(Ser) seleniumtransferase
LWDRKKFGLSGEAVSRVLFEGEPRITMSPTRGDNPSQTGVGITPYMMAAGEEIIVADKLHAAITNPPAAAKDPATPPPAPAGDVSGRWDVQIQYAASKSTHTLQLRQKGSDIEGSHQGDFVTRDISGTLEGDALRLRSGINEDHGDAINCTFNGKLAGDAISGTLDMGEYRSATWTATRRARGTRGSA